MSEHARGASSPDELVKQIRESAMQIWLAGLGAFAKAQEEGGKLFEALTKEGEAIQETARKAAGERISEIAAQAAGTWDKLGEMFEERVAQALHRLNVPSKNDIAALNRRVDKLSAVAERISPRVAKERSKARPVPRAGQGRKPKARGAR